MGNYLDPRRVHLNYYRERRPCPTLDLSDPIFQPCFHPCGSRLVALPATTLTDARAFTWSYRSRHGNSGLQVILPPKPGAAQMRMILIAITANKGTYNKIRLCRTGFMHGFVPLAPVAAANVVIFVSLTTPNTLPMSCQVCK